MHRAKVSVIIPVYNKARFLDRCMESVLAQTLGELEIILVDDGSTDGSGVLCDAYALRDGRVRVIHKQNAGLGYARNSGLEIASGAYVAFLDSDDYVDHTMYETLYTLATKHDADACIGGYRRVRDGVALLERRGALSGLFEGDAVVTEIYLNLLGAEASCQEDFLILWQSACFSLYSLAHLRRHNILFDSERVFSSEDQLFNMAFFSSAQRVYVCNEPFYNYNETENSLSLAYRPDRFFNATKMYGEQVRRMLLSGFDAAISEEAKRRLQRTYLSKTRNSITRLTLARPRWRDVRGDIAAICKSEELRAVLAEYPWRKNALKQRAFNRALEKNRPFTVYLLCRLRNVAG